MYSDVIIYILRVSILLYVFVKKGEPFESVLYLILFYVHM